MNRTQQQQQGQQQGMRFGAHEFLVTQETIRSKGAEIELYGVLISQCQDAHLRDILTNQQRRMVQGYQQCLAVLNNQGFTPQVPHTPQTNVYENINIGLNNPQFPMPNPQANRLSDQSIATIALNLHKFGAISCMNFALECANPVLRQFHATSANTCQEMAYELFQFANYQGMYQVPQLADHTMQTMVQAFSAPGYGGGQGYGAQQQQGYNSPMALNRNF